MNLFDDYLAFCRLRGSIESNTLDLTRETFFRPTTLLPLCAHVYTNNIRILEPYDPNAASYVRTIRGTQFRESSEQRKTYVPFVKLPKELTGASRILDGIYDVQNIEHYGGENAFKYLVGEIVDNIYEHSEFVHAFVMAQAYPKLRFMDVCFVDDGVTINGCYRKNGIEDYDDSHAIAAAVKGLSTKGNGRGTGLRSSVRIITRGARGQFLIVSGRGYLAVDHDNCVTGNLETDFSLDGTLVSIRIPYGTPKIDIYRHLGA
ncbi:MAG: hypothetical protein ACTSVD_01790 [Candidatus Thorarchaeota archaeon]